MKGSPKLEAKKEKSVGCRVDNNQYQFIMKHAKSEKLNQSDFVMKSMMTHTNLKKHKMIIIEALHNYLKDARIIFDLDKKKNLQEALKYLIEL